MMEIKVTITAPDLSEAINHLAVALSGTSKAAPVIDSTALNNTEDKNQVAAAQAPVTAPAAAPVAPVQTMPQQAPVVPMNQPVQNTVPVGTATPTEAKVYELDDIANAMAALIDEGKMVACMATIRKYGVPAINLLPKESYPAFAEDLKALGAKF